MSKLGDVPPRTFSHVAVLMGGLSAERSVSLRSGTAVADALESEGYRVTRIDVDRDVARRIEEVSARGLLQRASWKIRRGRLHPGHPRDHGYPVYAFGRAVVGARHAQGARQGSDEAAAGVPVAEAKLVTRREAAESDVLPRPMW